MGGTRRGSTSRERVDRLARLRRYLAYLATRATMNAASIARKAAALRRYFALLLARAQARRRRSCAQRADSAPPDRRRAASGALVEPSELDALMAPPEVANDQTEPPTSVTMPCRCVTTPSWSSCTARACASVNAAALTSTASIWTTPS